MEDQLKLKRAEAELAKFPSQSLLDRATYLRALADLPRWTGSSLTAKQWATLAWLHNEGHGRQKSEVTHDRKLDLTRVHLKGRGPFVEHARVGNEPWVFLSDLGCFALQDRADKEATS
jgi:hypothetical protein